MNLYNIYTESALVKAERDKLSDSSFGLPKTRQYPLHDAEHVRKAIQMFGHCPEKDRKELADNIYTAAKKFSVIISEKSLVFKYLSKSQQNELLNKKELNENLPFLDLVDFYQIPLTEETIERYGKYYSHLSILKETEDSKGTILIDHNDQVVGFIQLNAKTGYLKNIEVNPIYRNQGIGSKLLSTTNGKMVSTVSINPDDLKTINFFKKNDFEVVDGSFSRIMKRKISLNEDRGFLLSGDTLTMDNILDEKLDEVIKSISTKDDIVTRLESYLDCLKETSVAGVAAPAMLVGQTIRKSTVDCPNMFDYDEFYEPEESKFVCSENVHTTTFDTTEPVDVAKNIPDKTINSTSKIQKPQAMIITDEGVVEDDGDTLINSESSVNEDQGIVGAIIWDVIKFIVKLPFKIGKFVAKRIKNSDSHKIEKAIKAYRKAYDECLDLSKIAKNYKEISLKELCKELGKSTREIDRLNTDAMIKVTAWYKGKHLISYFIEILENKNSTQYEYVLGIVDSDYAKDPTKTLLCAIMEYTTNSYGKYLDRLNTILRKRGENLLEDVGINTEIDATASPNSKVVDYKDQSSDVITGIDRYTNHKDKYGCYYVALNANEYEDQVQKNLILPYINEDMFISADFHLNHKNRNSANLANLLVSEINSKVPIDGTFMILGDLGNKGDPNQKEYIWSFIRRLNVSRKILILGNHDNLSLKDYYDMGFTFVSDRLENDDYIFSHCPEDPKNKINIHGHIHDENEYWNIPAERHINAYIASHGNKVYTLREYLEFYKQGRYKGKSVKKRFD